jgi:cyclic pyranopterin phosphate synthase
MARSRRSDAVRRLTHVDGKGARMVDVSAKSVTDRRAVARATVRLKPATLRRVLAGKVAKGSVLEVARIAGIQAAKRTSELIPLCHPIALGAIRVDLVPRAGNRIDIEAEVQASDRTGVEMEALVAATAAGLTVYDMLKAIERGITLTDVRLVAKEGGASGRWSRGSR